LPNGIILSIFYRSSEPLESKHEESSKQISIGHMPRPGNRFLTSAGMVKYQVKQAQSNNQRIEGSKTKSKLQNTNHQQNQDKTNLKMSKTSTSIRF